jgi:hypothetical protein
MKVLNEENKSTPVVDKRHLKPTQNRKEEIEKHNFKLQKFKNV